MSGSNRVYAKACFAALVAIQAVGLTLVAVPFAVKGASGLGEALEMVAQCFLFGAMGTFLPTLIYSLMLGLIAESSETFFWPPALVYVVSAILTILTYFISRGVWLAWIGSGSNPLAGPDFLLLLAAIIAGCVGACVATQVIRRAEER